jgi:hypothetical protein
MGEFMTKLTHQSLVAGALPIRELAIPLLTRIEQHFSVDQRNLDAAQSDLNSFQHLIEQESPHWRRSYQHIHDWFAGRLAAIQGRETDAMDFYAKAVEGVWWFGGPNQLPMLNEALLYAVGVGDSVAAKHYWDKTFMLGLNRWPKRPLDEQERRRLAFSFERQFSPQKAKDRIPPPVEFILRDTPFELSQEQLKNPNRKVKHAEGRTRRTPLMDAACEGSLSDVKRAIAAGGDPNDFIKESGEGPLTYAMRRACDRGDPVIMDYLLKLDLSQETVNRQASTSRETPLKIAIEMADAKAVERLIVLDADVEQASDYVPSALCYAMLLLHGSIHRTDPRGSVPGRKDQGRRPRCQGRRCTGHRTGHATPDASSSPRRFAAKSRHLRCRDGALHTARRTTSQSGAHAAEMWCRRQPALQGRTS